MSKFTDPDMVRAHCKVKAQEENRRLQVMECLQRHDVDALIRLQDEASKEATRRWQEFFDQEVETILKLGTIYGGEIPLPLAKAIIAGKFIEAQEKERNENRS